jgi:hypothetical protein
MLAQTRPLVKMVKKKKTETLPSRLLADALAAAQIRELFGDVFECLSVDDRGDLAPTYRSEGDEGHGAVLCQYMPLEAIERLVEECRRGVPAREAAKAGWEPEALTEAVVRITAILLLTNFSSRLKAALEANFEDARLFTAALRRSFLNVGLEDADEEEIYRQVVTDMRPRIEAAAAKASDSERRRAEQLIGRLPGLLTARRKVGRPRAVSTEQVLQVLSRRGKVSAEKVAEELGRDVSALKTWAKGTPWKRWVAARDALLTQLKKGGN